MPAPTERHMQRGLRVIVGCLAASVAIRSYEFSVLRAALAEETGSLSGANVEGNARVVGGFAVAVLQLSSLTALLHILVLAVVISFIIYRIAAPANPSADGRYRNAITGYFATGLILGSISILVPIFGLFVAADMLWAFWLGWWGGAITFFGVIAPAVAAWTIRLRIDPPETVRESTSAPAPRAFTEAIA